MGSGLGAFGDDLENAVKIPYEEIPHFQKSTVEGHAGQLVLGEVEGVPVAVQQGRFHFYEGYEMEKVIFPVRTFGVLGVKSLILTNAAGSVDTDYKQGTLMLIRDHINLMGVNPLRGEKRRTIRRAISRYDGSLFARISKHRARCRRGNGAGKSAAKRKRERAKNKRRKKFCGAAFTADCRVRVMKLRRKFG